MQIQEIEPLKEFFDAIKVIETRRKYQAKVARFLERLSER